MITFLKSEKYNMGKNEIANKAVNAVKTKAVTVKDGISEIDMEKILDSCYQQAVDGIPKVSKPIDELVEDYSRKHDSIEDAATALIRGQLAKCSTSGFLTGLGGAITLPVAIPANISSVIYIQLRMIAAIAKLGGYNPRDDQVQTLAYVCLTGQAVSAVMKDTGINIGGKMAVAGIKKIPGEALVKINQKVGFRLLTKFGEKGAINLGKAVPIVGGLIGGGFDFATTKIIADNAYKMFIKKSI